MLDKVVARIQDLEKSLEQSAANHNALLGAMQEAKNIYQIVMESKNVAEEVAEVIEAL